MRTTLPKQSAPHDTQHTTQHAAPHTAPQDTAPQPGPLPTNLLPTNLRRYCGDWLAQFLWAIENDLEEPRHLHTTPQPHDPRPKGALDPDTGLLDPDHYLHQASVDEPHLTVYACYLPPEPRLDFTGKRVYLLTSHVTHLRRHLDHRDLLEPWDDYRDGGTYQIFAYHRPSDSMQRTPKARATPGIGRAAEALADWFTPQVLHEQVLQEQGLREPALATGRPSDRPADRPPDRPPCTRQTHSGTDPGTDPRTEVDPPAAPPRYAP